MAETTKQQQSLVFPLLLVVLLGIAYFEVRTYLEGIPAGPSKAVVSEQETATEKPQTQIVLQKDDSSGVTVQLTDSIQLRLIAPEQKVAEAPIAAPREAVYVPPQQPRYQPRPQPRRQTRKPDDMRMYETPDEYLLRKYQEAHEKKVQEQVW